MCTCQPFPTLDSFSRPLHLSPHQPSPTLQCKNYHQQIFISECVNGYVVKCHVANNEKFEADEWKWASEREASENKPQRWVLSQNFWPLWWHLVNQAKSTWTRREHWPLRWVRVKFFWIKPAVWKFSLAANFTSFCQVSGSVFYFSALKTGNSLVLRQFAWENAASPPSILSSSSSSSSSSACLTPPLRHIHVCPSE